MAGLQWRLRWPLHTSDTNVDEEVDPTMTQEQMWLQLLAGQVRDWRSDADWQSTDRKSAVGVSVLVPQHAKLPKHHRLLLPSSLLRHCDAVIGAALFHAPFAHWARCPC